MKKFIVIYHAPTFVPDRADKMSSDQQTAIMEAWTKWAQNCGDKLVDMGSPLTNSLELVWSGKSEKSSKGVVGYSILQANTMEEIKTLLKGHPHLNWGSESTIEVHESIPPPGM